MMNCLYHLKETRPKTEKKKRKKFRIFPVRLRRCFTFHLVLIIWIFRLLVVYSYGALTFCTEISVKIFREWNGTGTFLVAKTGRTGLRGTIYKIPVKFLLSLVKKRSTSNPNQWYRKFRSFL